MVNKMNRQFEVLDNRIKFDEKITIVDHYTQQLVCDRTVVQVQICYTENVNIYSSFNDIYIAEVNQALLAWSFQTPGYVC